MTTLQTMLDDITARARVWPLIHVVQTTKPGHLGVAIPSEGVPQAHLTCGACGQSVICLNPDLTRGTGYEVTAREITTSVAAHLRQCHDESG